VNSYSLPGEDVESDEKCWKKREEGREKFTTLFRRVKIAATLSI